jgi:hypothetical protein
MLPVRSLRLTIGTLLAADATGLAPATNPNEVALIIAPFAETENLVIGDLVLASANGLAAIVGVAGAQQTGNDPVTQEQLVTIKEPAGGWRFILTSTPGSPVTIYGRALTTTAGGALLGVEILDTPVSLTNTGDEWNGGPVNCRIVVRPIT